MSDKNPVSRTGVSLKVQGHQPLVQRLAKLLEERVEAVPTGSDRPNDDDDGVHRFLVVSKRSLDRLEGLE